MPNDVFEKRMALLKMYIKNNVCFKLELFNLIDSMVQLTGWL